MDALGRLAALENENGSVYHFQYDPAGRLIEQQPGAIAQLSQKDRHFHPDQYRPEVQAGMQAAIRRRYHHDPSGQLASIDDSRRGRIEYRYDPFGRLLGANSALGHETFAFDPAGNIQAPDAAQQEQFTRPVPLPKMLNNLLKEYAGTSYRYDERGNLIEHQYNAQRDPIGPHGGLNLHRYAPNPLLWIDPLGLAGFPAVGTDVGGQWIDAS